jgi:hypothetical protein
VTSAPEPPGPPEGDPPVTPLPTPFEEFVVPDDARELEADRLAWLREQRRAELSRGWGRLWRRVLLTRRWERYGLSGPLVVAVLVVVAAVGSLVVVLGPRTAQRPPAAPLALDAGSSVGPGSLLPDAILITRFGERSARDARPAVLALVPDDCGCDAALSAVFTQASEFRLRMWLVGETASLVVTRRLAARVGNGTAEAAEDVAGTLRPAYDAHGLTLLLVHADGVVRQVLRDVPEQPRLEGQLALLSTAGATSASAAGPRE